MPQTWHVSVGCQGEILGNQFYLVYAQMSSTQQKPLTLSCCQVLFLFHIHSTQCTHTHTHSWPSGFCWAPLCYIHMHGLTKGGSYDCTRNNGCTPHTSKLKHIRIISFAISERASGFPNNASSISHSSVDTQAVGVNYYYYYVVLRHRSNQLIHVLYITSIIIIL